MISDFFKCSELEDCSRWLEQIRRLLIQNDVCPKSSLFSSTGNFNVFWRLFIPWEVKLTALQFPAFMIKAKEMIGMKALEGSIQNTAPSSQSSGLLYRFSKSFLCFWWFGLDKDGSTQDKFFHYCCENGSAFPYHHHLNHLKGVKTIWNWNQLKNKHELNQINFSLIHHSERSAKLETMIKDEEHFLKGSVETL